MDGEIGMQTLWVILIWILKGLGLLLGSLVLLVVILVVVLLVVPICYQVDLEKEDNFLYGARVSWLLSFLQFLYHKTPQDKTMEFKILGFTIKKKVEAVEADQDRAKDLSEVDNDLWASNWQKLEEEEFKEKLYRYLAKDKEKADPENFQSSPKASGWASQPEVKPELEPPVHDRQGAIPSELSVNKGERPKADKPARQTVGDWLDQDEKSESKTWSREKTYEDRWNDWDEDWDQEETYDRNPVKEIGENPPLPEEAAGKIKTKYKKMRQKLDDLWFLFQEIRTYFSQNQGIIKHLFHWLFRILRSILPRKLEGRIEFGLEDPSHTGYALGIFYLFYPENRGRMMIDYNFERFVIKGQVKIKGRISLISLVYYGLRMVLDGRVLGLLGLARRLKKDLAAMKDRDYKNTETGTSNVNPESMG